MSWVLSIKPAGSIPGGSGQRVFDWSIFWRPLFISNSLGSFCIPLFFETIDTTYDLEIISYFSDLGLFPFGNVKFDPTTYELLYFTQSIYIYIINILFACVCSMIKLFVKPIGNLCRDANVYRDNQAWATCLYSPSSDHVSNTAKNELFCICCHHLNEIETQQHIDTSPHLGKQPTISNRCIVQIVLSVLIYLLLQWSKKQKIRKAASTFHFL